MATQQPRLPEVRFVGGKWPGASVPVWPWLQSIQVTVTAGYAEAIIQTATGHRVSVTQITFDNLQAL